MWITDTPTYTELITAAALKMATVKTRISIFNFRQLNVIFVVHWFIFVECDMNHIPIRGCAAFKSFLTCLDSAQPDHSQFKCFGWPELFMLAM